MSTRSQLTSSRVTFRQRHRRSDAPAPALAGATVGTSPTPWQTSSAPRSDGLARTVKEARMTSVKVGVGLVGSGFIGGVHAETISRSALASVRAVASRSADSAEAFATQWGIPAWHTDYRELVAREDVDLVCVAAPNWLHRDIVVAAAEAGKHVVCEKPLARTLDEDDEMIAACRGAGIKLMYAEELCFAPMYVRAKELADEGALGEVYLVRQSEQHFGPHSEWFWEPELAGGGVLMDMACHGIEFARW